MVLVVHGFPNSISALRVGVYVLIIILNSFSKCTVCKLDLHGCMFK